MYIYDMYIYMYIYDIYIYIYIYIYTLAHSAHAIFNHQIQKSCDMLSIINSELHVLGRPTKYAKLNSLASFVALKNTFPLSKLDVNYKNVDDFT
jgi:hypothetical protein